jgi:hypothetical protein
VIDDLTLGPQQGMSAWDAKARMLVLDLFKLLPQWLILARLGDIAGAGTSDFRQATGLPLG